MEIVNIKPLNGNILIKDSAAEEKTKGGIYIPDASKKEIVTGIVLAVSSKITDKGTVINPDLKEGDKILYKSVAGAGNCWKVDSDTYRILNPVEILATVE